MSTLKYLPEAIEDIKNLDGSLKVQVLKGIRKASQNPLPQEKGGYGKRLGNKGGNDLTGLFKIKFRGIGIRAVYMLVEQNDEMLVIVVSLRSDNQVYDMAAKRRVKHNI